MDRTLLLLTIISIALGPFYLWESGLPQLAHLVMAVAIGFHLLSAGFRWRRWWNWLIGFAFYTALINIVVFLIYRDSHSLLSSLYYLFNALAFIHIVSLAERTGGQRFLKSVHLIFWVLVVLEFALVLTGKERVYGGARAMGTFNDPNQMANWLVIVAMCLFAIGWAVYRSWLIGTVATAFVFVLMAFSASRSGALGLLVILALVGSLGFVRFCRLLGGRYRFSLLRWLVIIASVMLAMCTVSLFLATNTSQVTMAAADLGDRIQRWFLRFGDSSPWTSFEGRGYDRLWKFPEYLVFGAGEGANNRWLRKTWFLGEIHSTPAGVVFYYGIFGSSFLVFFLWNLFKRLHYTWLRLSFLAPFAYGVGTYNLRNWFLWLGMAVLYVAAEHVSRSMCGATERASSAATLRRSDRESAAGSGIETSI